MSFRSFIGRCALSAVVVVVALVPPRSLAQPAPLTLDQALSRAIAENPALRGSEYLLQAARARELRAAQSPPLSVAAELEDFTGSGALRGADQLQTTLRLSGVLELGGRRSARLVVAERETDIAIIDQRAQRLDLLAQVAARFVEVAERQERALVTRTATRLAEMTVERVAERMRIGAAPSYELGRAEIRQARARIEQEHAEHELESARVHLSASWGASTPGFDRVSADLFALSDTKSFEQLTREIDASPAIARILSRERLAKAQLALARSARSPEIAWSGGVRHLQSVGDTALVASFAVPFGARRRAEPLVQEADALGAKLPLDVQSARVETNALLFDLYQELLHARLEARALREQVQPRSESVLQSTEQAFAQGRTTFLELASAQQQLLEVRGAAVAAAARFHKLLIEIERLTGTTLAAADGNTGESQ